MRFPPALWLVASIGLAQAPDGYAPPDACAKCHASIAASYAETAMARSFQKLMPGMDRPEFSGRSFTHLPSAQTFTAFQREGHFLLSRNTDGDIEKEAHYAFGSGNHARSFLHRTPAGRLIELPLTWYARAGGYWAMSPAFDRADHPGFTREINFQCLFCHNAYPAVAKGADWSSGSAVFPANLPEGIDCQRCHGPGAAHAASPARNPILNPRKLSTARQLEICMQCHLETTSLSLPAALPRTGRGIFSYRPGEPLEDYIVHFTHPSLAENFDLVSAVTRMRQSACFRQSENRMTCTTCHDPHRVRKAAEFDAACRNCHQTLTAKHPVANNCAGCHMPKRRPSDVIHASVTDHFIVARPAPVVTPPEERHDGNTPPFRGPVSLYYPERLADEITVAVAQVKHGANLETGLVMLGAALRKYQPPSSEPYFEYAEALRTAKRFHESFIAYEQAAAREPARWTHPYGFGLALAASGNPSRALEQFAKAASLAPSEPLPLFGRGSALAQLNRPREAIETLRRALVLNPELADVHNNLGTTLLSIGDLRAAEAEFLEAIRLRPDLSAARLNLAGLFLRLHRFNEAAEQARQALRTDEILGLVQRFRSRLMWGLALHGMGRPADARTRWTEAAKSPDAQVRQLAQELLTSAK